MFRNAVRKRLRGNRLRRIPVKPTCLRRAASSMETGGGWLLSSGRIVDFNTPALRGQGSQALVLGHRCVCGGGSLHFDGLAESFWGATTVAHWGLCGFGAPRVHNWTRVVSVETR